MSTGWNQWMNFARSLKPNVDTHLRGKKRGGETFWPVPAVPQSTLLFQDHWHVSWNFCEMSLGFEYPWVIMSFFGSKTYFTNSCATVLDLEAVALNFQNNCGVFATHFQLFRCAKWPWENRRLIVQALNVSGTKSRTKKSWRQSLWNTHVIC